MFEEQRKETDSGVSCKVKRLLCVFSNLRIHENLAETKVLDEFEVGEEM